METFLDLNNDGLIDVVWWDQLINVTQPGLVNVGNYSISSSAKNSSGGAQSHATVGSSQVFEFPTSGQVNLSYWLGSDDLAEFVRKNYDHKNVTCKPVLRPLFSNMTPAGPEIQGTEKIISLDSWNNFSAQNRGGGIVTPAIKDLMANTSHGRTIGETYTWSYKTKPGVYSSPYGFQFGLDLFIKANNTFAIELLNISTPIPIKGKIGNGSWSDETVTGIPYTHLLIPKNLEIGALFHVMNTSISFWKYYAMNIENVTSQFEMYIGPEPFVGYNLTVNGTDFKFWYSLVYHIPSGSLRLLEFDLTSNGRIWVYHTVELIHPQVGFPSWSDTTEGLPSASNTTESTISSTTITPSPGFESLSVFMIIIGGTSLRRLLSKRRGYEK